MGSYLNDDQERGAKALLRSYHLNPNQLSPRQLRKLVRACEGRAWEGDPSRWVQNMDGVLEYWLGLCEDAGVVPELLRLYSHRKMHTRTWAMQQGLMGEEPEVFGSDDVVSVDDYDLGVS